MSLATYEETLVSQKIAGTLYNTYTTAKTVIPAQCLYQFPVNYFVEGKTFHITVIGGLSNIVTTPGTVTFSCMLGSVVVFTTGAIQLNATAHTLLPFWLEIYLTCRATGSSTSANLIGMGRLQGIAPTLTAGQVDEVNGGGVFSVPATAPAVGTGFDSSATQVLDFFAGFSISNAGNGVQVHQYVVESLN